MIPICDNQSLNDISELEYEGVPLINPPRNRAFRLYLHSGGEYPATTAGKLQFGNNEPVSLPIRLGLDDELTEIPNFVQNPTDYDALDDKSVLVNGCNVYMTVSKIVRNSNNEIVKGAYGGAPAILLDQFDIETTNTTRARKLKFKLGSIRLDRNELQKSINSCEKILKDILYAVYTNNKQVAHKNSNISPSTRDGAEVTFSLEKHTLNEESGEVYMCFNDPRMLFRITNCKNQKIYYLDYPMNKIEFTNAPSINCIVIKIASYIKPLPVIIPYTNETKATTTLGDFENFTTDITNESIKPENKFKELIKKPLSDDNQYKLTIYDNTQYPETTSELIDKILVDMTDHILNKDILELINDKNGRLYEEDTYFTKSPIQMTNKDIAKTDWSKINGCLEKITKNHIELKGGKIHLENWFTQAVTGAEKMTIQFINNHRAEIISES